MVDRLFLKMPVRLLGDRKQSPSALNIRWQCRTTLPIGVGRFPARSATALQASEKEEQFRLFSSSRFQVSSKGF
jgi:hypothetical protein